MIIKNPTTIIKTGGGGGATEEDLFAKYLSGTLTEVKAEQFPQGITKIISYAFAGYTNFNSAEIPYGITHIGLGAFYNCQQFTKVTIPSTVTSILTDAFRDSALANIYITDLDAWTNINNSSSMGTINKKTIYLNGSYITDLSALTQKATQIGNYAFTNNKYLKTANMPNSVTSIGNYAFNNTTTLTSVTMPNSVLTIGNSAFSGCTGLTEITIPENITRIGTYAFTSCNNLKTITILATTPPTLASTNAIVSSYVTTIYIPAGTLSVYQTASNWKSYASKFVELNADGTIPS